MKTIRLLSARGYAIDNELLEALLEDTPLHKPRIPEGLIFEIERRVTSGPWAGYSAFCKSLGLDPVRLNNIRYRVVKYYSPDLFKICSELDIELVNFLQL